MDNNIREKLAELLEENPFIIRPRCDVWQEAADWLLAHGVTVLPEQVWVVSPLQFKSPTVDGLVDGFRLRTVYQVMPVQIRSLNDLLRAKAMHEVLYDTEESAQFYKRLLEKESACLWLK